MPARFRLFMPSRAFPVLGALAILVFAVHGATAQTATGTVTGRVLWGPCIRGIPLPMTPGGQAAPGTAQSIVPPDVQIAPAVQPASVNGLPAGAVLVAVQNTAISARTDEVGKFTLSGVPAGQYMTIAAGPVADSASATAARPNVFVSGGQTVDVGTLALGGSSAAPFAIACRGPLGIDPAQGGAANPAVPAPAPADTMPSTTTPPQTDAPSP